MARVAVGLVTVAVVMDAATAGPEHDLEKTVSTDRCKGHSYGEVHSDTGLDGFCEIVNDIGYELLDFFDRLVRRGLLSHYGAMFGRVGDMRVGGLRNSGATEHDQEKHRGHACCTSDVPAPTPACSRRGL
ncbi:hypothetical protein [Streptomyces longisporoflavus]|uniref:hypothetical protein n=1 Tax=Streptomyces longisporoflavus TaxID=28044 RepID=UPI001E5B8A7E|nr:hypothetical protein [Streptomyces longisporoflavus]